MAACFCQQGSELLFLLRHPQKSQGLTWCIPGGKLISGETPLDAAVRELKEESGIALPGVALTFKRTFFVTHADGDFTFHIFHAELPQKPEQILLSPTEHTEFRWMTPKEALKFPLTGGAGGVLKLLFAAHFDD